MSELAARLEACDLHVAFNGREVIRGISLKVAPGQLTLIKGPSGSGKTTLLNTMAGLEKPTSGKVLYDGVNIYAGSRKDLEGWRGGETGYVFQRAALLGGLTVRDNIVIPATLQNISLDPDWTSEVCVRLGLLPLLNGSSLILSGGEQQRVSLARALVHKPHILFADEPSAALDSDTTRELHTLIREVVTEMGATVLMVSHDESSSSYADRTIALRDGKVVHDSQSQEAALDSTKL